MKISALMTIAAIVAGLFGVGFVLVPAEVLAPYGVTADPSLEYMSRLFGAALILVAVLTWTARNATDSQAGRAIMLAIFVGDSAGFVVALLGQLAGVVNALGWSTVAIYLFFALGFGYFYFGKPASTAAA